MEFIEEFDRYLILGDSYQEMHDIRIASFGETNVILALAGECLYQLTGGDTLKETIMKYARDDGLVAKHMIQMKVSKKNPMSMSMSVVNTGNFDHR